MNTEEISAERYRTLVNKSKLPSSIIDSLLSRPTQTWDELAEAFADFIHFLKHTAYYDALDRYERGTELLAQETRPAVQAKYRARLNELSAEIERLRPKEESA